ncbi:hypothetical protein Tco_0608878 [Tanacetum coccineum]
MLEKEFNEKEVWEAIHGCGGGPDGFNFKFIRKFWEIIKPDLLKAVMWFWDKSKISKGCNSSFITIIPKVANLIGLGDFRPISLIGCYNKVIAKEVSSLRVNYNKSKLYGIGVNEMDLMDMAGWMRCGVKEFPFTYLGLPIGVNMRLINAWNPIVENFKNRLVDWKAKTMYILRELEKNSFGVGLGKGKSVLGQMGYDSCITWGRGLNIRALRAKNLALLGKWWERFRKEGGSLWVRVVKSIHGTSGGLGNNRVLGRGGNRGEVVALGMGVGEEYSGWTLFNDGEFKVKELSRVIEEKIIHVESEAQETLWNKLVPKKCCDLSAVGMFGGPGSILS